MAPMGGCDGTANYCKALYDMFKDDVDTRACPIVDYPAIPSRLFKYYYRHKPLAEAIKKAEIVHINGYTAMGTAQALYLAHHYGKQVVYTAHWHPFNSLRHPFLGKTFFRFIIKPLVRRCAHKVVAINNEDLAFFKAFHPHVEQIPHWYAAEEPASHIAKKKNMILFIGRINDPMKNFSTLYSLPEGKYEVHCVGRGELATRPDFIQHINLSDEALGQLYDEASLVVIPSKYEAFSYVALEAMSHGTPVVMSDRVRIADYLLGIRGYSVFKYNDDTDFLKKVEATIGSTVDRQAIKDLFAPERIKLYYKKIYSE